MKSQDLKNISLPDVPGVYYFLSSKPKARILYVGKATSLKDRIKSYFSKDILLTRGPKIQKMLEEADSVNYVQTDSVLEALILEANEIKRLQPPYNSIQKDDKSYNFVTITKSEFPQVLVTRGSGDYGPFPHSRELKEALKIVRKIFPYRDEKCRMATSPRQGGARPCFNAQIGLCPGPCAGRVSKLEYRKTIRNIKLFFEGKKEKLVKSLEKEMLTLAKSQKFEEADKIKRQLFALNHIQDIALIKSDFQARSSKLEARSFRIEAYDVAHISGTNVVGVMTVVVDGEADKSQYRKFKIRKDKNDDVGNLREIISRRFSHPEWQAPNLVVVDGGKAQISAVQSELKKFGLEMIEVVSVVKDERHRPKNLLNLRDKKLEKPVLLANAEAHRFAINYHRLLRSKGFRI